MKIKLVVPLFLVILLLFASSYAQADVLNIGMRVDFLNMGGNNIPYFGFDMNLELIPSLATRISASFSSISDVVSTLLELDGIYKLFFPGDIFTPYLGGGLSVLSVSSGQYSGEAIGGNIVGGVEVSGMSLEGGLIYLFDLAETIFKIGIGFLF
jgi:hypothetical protein